MYPLFNERSKWQRTGTAYLLSFRCLFNVFIYINLTFTLFLQSDLSFWCIFHLRTYYLALQRLLHHYVLLAFMKIVVNEAVSNIYGGFIYVQIQGRTRGKILANVARTHLCERSQFPLVWWRFPNLLLSFACFLDVSCFQGGKLCLFSCTLYH